MNRSNNFRSSFVTRSPAGSWEIIVVALVSLAVLSPPAFAQAERRVVTVTADVDLQVDGYTDVAEADFVLSEPVPLDGVSSFVIETLLYRIEHPTGGSNLVHTGMAFLSGDTVVGEAEGAVLRWRGNRGGATRRIRFPIDSDAVIDGLRVKLWVTQLDVGGGADPTATVVGLRNGQVGLHFVQGTHAVRRIGPVEQIVLDGAASPSPWMDPPHSFAEPVPADGLRLLFHSAFGANGNLGGTSQSELILDDECPVSRLRLDDAFSPSRGAPSSGWTNSGHSLLLDTETRLAIRDCEIVGWRWRVVQSGGGRRTMSPVVNRGFLFFYDDSDCDADGITDLARLSAGAPDADEDGVPDDCGGGPLFVRGDANADGTGNVTDAVYVLDHLFGGGEVPPCAKSADADDSGTVDLRDAVYVLNFLFTGGAPPAAPFAECGQDPSVDELSCDSFPSC